MDNAPLPPCALEAAQQRQRPSFRYIGPITGLTEAVRAYYQQLGRA